MISCVAQQATCSLSDVGRQGTSSDRVVPAGIVTIIFGARTRDGAAAAVEREEA